MYVKGSGRRISKLEQIIHVSSDHLLDFFLLADFVHKLIGDSQRQLHDVFTRTYGVLYERNSALFADYFRRIRSFYSRGAGGSLQDATLKFFTQLYRKMFQASSPYLSGRNC